MTFPIKCSKCPNYKDLDEFQLLRRGTKYEYRLTYCKDCRIKQINANYNSDCYKVLKDTFVRLKSRAKKNSVQFDLDFGYFKSIFDIQQGKCFYSNKELSLKRGVGFNDNSCTVDKVIPELGYIAGNIVFCTKRFNSVKYDLSMEEISLHLPTWYDKIIKTDWLTLGSRS